MKDKLQITRTLNTPTSTDKDVSRFGRVFFQHFIPTNGVIQLKFERLRMEEEVKETFRYEEWTIENFSCWNREIHDKCISTLKTDFSVDFIISLYPRGEDGQGEFLFLRFDSSGPIAFSGELSYIGPDGSVLYTEQMDSTEKTRVKTVNGPRFEEVISAIRKSEDVHGDRLIIRYHLKRPSDYEEFRRTTIEVFHVTLRITPGMIDQLQFGERIASLIYPIEEMVRRFDLIISKDDIDCTRTIFMLQPNDFVSNVSVFTRLAVLSSGGVVLRTEENENLFRDNTVWTFAKSLTKEQMRRKDGFFTLHFKIIPKNKMKQNANVVNWYKDGVSVIKLNTIVKRNQFPEKESSLSLQHLSEELMYLQQDEHFSDCQLKCGAITFSAHKNILTARSPVLKNMFSCDMQEAASGFIVIKDMDPSTMAHFLAFLYTGKVREGLKAESAPMLYYAADKYQVPTLKKECADFLCSDVSVSNVCDILALADKHKDDQILKAVHDFFQENLNEVLSSKEWSSFMTDEPLLAVKTLTQTVTHKVEKC